MVIISNLDKREYIPISNNYEVINESNDDFHLVIYYLDYNKIKIIVRRLDSITGWGVDLKIKIYSINSNEIISLGSSEDNSKIINIYTDIKIFKENFENQLIPKLIIQTSFSKNIENLLHYNSILTYIELNPEYEYMFYDNNECRLFIKNNFNKTILYSYDLIIPGAFKADFFRYCFLYINGGCYFDCKSILRIPLRKIIKYNDELILCKDMSKGYYNAIIFTVKNNKLILDAINLCVYNINNINIFYNMKKSTYMLLDTLLSLTGPVLLYNAIYKNITKNNIKLYHRFENIKYNEYIIKHEYQKLFIEMDGVYIITKQYRDYHSSSGIHYSEQWNKKELVYKYFPTLYTNKYKFYMYNKTSDIFEFYILNNNIMIIERKDFNSGWGIGFKLKIINEETNEDLILNIDSSICNFKKIYIQENFFKEDILIKSFYVNNTIDDFLLHIIDNGSDKKLIVFNNHRRPLKNLNVNLTLNNKKYNIDISNSELPLKVVDINI